MCSRPLQVAPVASAPVQCRCPSASSDESCRAGSVPAAFLAEPHQHLSPPQRRTASQQCRRAAIHHANTSCSLPCLAFAYLNVTACSCALQPAGSESGSEVDLDWTFSTM